MKPLSARKSSGWFSCTGRALFDWRYGIALSVLLWPPAAGALNVGAALKAGTTGAGGDLTLGLSRAFNIRAGAYYLPLSFVPEIEGLPEEFDEFALTVDLRLLSVPVLLDWHPGGKNFRLSGGMAVNRNRVSLHVAGQDPVPVESRGYSVETLAADVTFSPWSPYVGLGVGNAVRKANRLRFAMDLGLLYHGVPRWRLRATASDPSHQEALDRDLARLDLAQIDEVLHYLRVYPVLSLGLSYRF